MILKIDKTLKTYFASFPIAVYANLLSFGSWQWTNKVIIKAFTNLVFGSYWVFWDSAWHTHCRTFTVYCTVMILEHWTNTKYIKKQWVFSLSNLFILTDKFSHSIKKYRTHHGDNLVWAPQTHMVDKLNSIQSQFGIWLLSKQTFKNYLFKTRIM